MKLILENWKKFLKESNDDIVSFIKRVKDSKSNNCRSIDFRIESSRFKCLGVGTDKYVFTDLKKPGWVLKFEKANPVKDSSTMEVVVWRYLNNTPFEKILSPIEEHDGFYYMARSSAPGNYQQLEDDLFSISKDINVKFKDLEYYFLSDANKDNIGLIDGKTVLVDYDDAYTWVRNNKALIKQLKGGNNVRR